MDGENNGKPYEKMDDLGGPPKSPGPLRTPLNPGCLIGILIMVQYNPLYVSYNPPYTLND